MAIAQVAGDAPLDMIVQRIVERVRPELILLFGSRAAGTARADSDYDLMLVVQESGDVDAARSAAYDALRERRFSVDILAVSAQDYARRQHDPGLLAWHVAREGRVLYSTGAVPQFTAPGHRIREEPPQEGLALWIRRADADLREAEISLASPDPVWDAICLHSHACIEKLLKAVIVQSGAFPPRTHDLRELLATQSPTIRDDVAIIAGCEVLMSLLPRSRYPDLKEPTPDEAREAIAAAREIHRRLHPRLPR